LKKFTEQPDFVVLDPPRAGLGRRDGGAAGDIGGTGDCLSFMRPVHARQGFGGFDGFGAEAADGDGRPGHRYEVSEVQLFDLFPQTYHIETLVRLRRVT